MLSRKNQERWLFSVEDYAMTKRFVLTLASLLLWSLPLGSGAMAQPKPSLACPTINVYVRDGCPHCAEAESYLTELRSRHSALRVIFHDVADPVVRQRFAELNEANNIARPGVPTLVVCDRLLIGFAPEMSPSVIENLVQFGEQTDSESSGIELPLFGNVTVSEFGLPLFTIAVGLVDGFNPCAMWVLLFLLSVLVNIRKRSRIIAIAGTFVIVSGLVYFAFMAAWLNAFLVIGFWRPLQMVLGMAAVLIGSIHIKDFFALHKGISMSIPERARPALYARVRRIVRAETLVPALVGAVILATVVNLVELLCTAGLPALYTQVLTFYDLPTWKYYAYLLLYNAAYMFDDGLMVTIAVVTLGHRKLQEREGRWLKLVSGLVIVALGLTLIAAPQWLVF